jgi:hypothetical protein
VALGALETCARALGACGSSCIGRPASLFFILEVRGSQGTVGHKTARSPPNREGGSGSIRHVAHRSPLSGSRAMVHVVVLEPTLVERRVSEPLVTWQPQRPSWLGGRVWCCMTRDDAWMHVSLFILT